MYSNERHRSPVFCRMGIGRALFSLIMHMLLFPAETFIKFVTNFIVR